MLHIPDWCTPETFLRFAGGQVSIINRYIDTSFHGDIGTINLDMATGRLIIDGGELMEAVFTFLPPGRMTLPRSRVLPADPRNPVDRTIRYVAGELPGGGTSALYGADEQGRPRRVNLEDDGM